MLYLHWISGNHDTQSFELFSWHFAVIIISTQWFPFSTHPCTRGLLAFPLTNLHSPGHASIVSTIRLFTNSLPLSECKMYGRPNTLNICYFNPWTTSFACFDLMMMMMMTMMMMMMNCFCGMADRRKVLSFISSRDHCQRSSPSQISGTPRAGFEPAQNLSSGLVEWSCAVVITTSLEQGYEIL